MRWETETEASTGCLWPARPGCRNSRRDPTPTSERVTLAVSILAPLEPVLQRVLVKAVASGGISQLCYFILASHAFAVGSEEDSLELSVGESGVGDRMADTGRVFCLIPHRLYEPLCALSNWSSKRPLISAFSGWRGFMEPWRSPITLSKQPLVD